MMSIADAGLALCMGSMRSAFGLKYPNQCELDANKPPTHKKMLGTFIINLHEGKKQTGNIDHPQVLHQI